MVDERAVSKAWHVMDQDFERDDFRTAIEAYETARWRPIHEVPITPNEPVYPTYVEMFNGHHVGIGYARISDDGEDRLEFWSETGEPIEPKPTMFRTIDPPPQDAVSRVTGPTKNERG